MQSLTTYFFPCDRDGGTDNWRSWTLGYGPPVCFMAGAGVLHKHMPIPLHPEERLFVNCSSSHSGPLCVLLALTGANVWKEVPLPF